MKGNAEIDPDAGFGGSVCGAASQRAKRAERNKAVKSELKTRVKNATASAGSPASAEDARVAQKRIDMAASKGIIHKNTAARRKSRLMKKVNAAG